MVTKIQAPDPLDALASQANATMQAQTTDAAAPGAPGAAGAGEGTPIALTNAQTLATALGLGRDVFCKFTKLQSPARVLTDDKVQELAAVWDPVLTKYGVNLGDMLKGYGPELAAIVSTAFVAWELNAAVRAELADRKAKDAEPAPAELATGDGAANDAAG